MPIYTVKEKDHPGNDVLMPDGLRQTYGGGKIGARSANAPEEVGLVRLNQRGNLGIVFRFQNADGVISRVSQILAIRTEGDVRR